MDEPVWPRSPSYTEEPIAADEQPVVADEPEAEPVAAEEEPVVAEEPVVEPAPVAEHPYAEQSFMAEEAVVAEHPVDWEQSMLEEPVVEEEPVLAEEASRPSSRRRSSPSPARRRRSRSSAEEEPWFVADVQEPKPARAARAVRHVERPRRSGRNPLVNSLQGYSSAGARPGARRLTLRVGRFQNQRPANPPGGAYATQGNRPARRSRSDTPPWLPILPDGKDAPHEKRRRHAPHVVHNT